MSIDKKRVWRRPGEDWIREMPGGMEASERSDPGWSPPRHCRPAFLRPAKKCQAECTIEEKKKVDVLPTKPIGPKLFKTTDSTQS